MPNPSEPIAKPYFPVLTGVRALAAYLVYFFHFNPFAAASGGPGAAGRALFSKFGLLGVATFFVLSGFLIAVRYAAGVTLSWRWAARYLWHRVARIYPLYGLLTGLTFYLFWRSPAYDTARVFAFYSESDQLLALLLNLTLLRGFFSQFLYSGLLQGWSLTVEMCFYLCAPWLLLSSRRSPWKLFFWPLGLLGLGALLVATCARHPVHGGFFDSFQLMSESTFFGRSSEFIVGIALAYFLKRQPPPIKSSFWRLAGGPISLLLLLILKIAVPFDNNAAMATSPLALVVNHVFLPVSIAWIFYGLLTERSKLGKLLESKLFQLLGKSSYSFYLIHTGAFHVALRNHLTTNIFLIFLSLVVMAVLLFKFVEHPLYKWLVAAVRPLAPAHSVHSPETI